MQQDAHEFLNFLINHINEIILCKYSNVLTCLMPHGRWRPKVVQFMQHHIILCVYNYLQL